MVLVGLPRRGFVGLPGWIGSLPRVGWGVNQVPWELALRCPVRWCVKIWRGSGQWQGAFQTKPFKF